MSRRLGERAQDMRTTLVRRTSVNRSYKRKKRKKKKLKTLTDREAELALLEPIEFMSRRPFLGVCGAVQVIDDDDGFLVRQSVVVVVTFISCAYLSVIRSVNQTVSSKSVSKVHFIWYADG